jgi:hypothetical protein
MAAKSSFPPFNVARQVALELNHKSRKEYLKWHDEHKPDYLPKFPNRVYKEFTSWNDWLGNQNVFQPNKGVDWRNIDEAAKWSQRLADDNDLNTMADWIEYANKNDIPDDIPKRPDVSYGVDWKGWAYWLGAEARSRIEAAKTNTHIFVIASDSNLATPGNYYSFIHCKMGESELIDKLKHASMRDVKVYRAYKWEDEQQDKVLELFKFFCKDKGEGKIFIANLNAMVFELDTLLVWHPLPDLNKKVPPAPPIDPSPYMFPDGVYRKKI